MYEAARITPVEAMNAMVVFLPNTESKVKYSPPKPDVPGNPIDPRTKIKKKTANLGITEFSPPKNPICFVLKRL